jgi:hypothetical protein
LPSGFCRWRQADLGQAQRQSRLGIGRVSLRPLEHLVLSSRYELCVRSVTQRVICVDQFELVQTRLV